MVGIVIIVEGDADLVKIVRTLQAVTRLTNPHYGWDKDSDQYPDDRNRRQ
jgi:hypothetical protein